MTHEAVTYFEAVCCCKTTFRREETIEAETSSGWAETARASVHRPPQAWVLSEDEPSMEQGSSCQQTVHASEFVVVNRWPSSSQPLLALQCLRFLLCPRSRPCCNENDDGAAMKSPKAIFYVSLIITTSEYVGVEGRIQWLVCQEGNEVDFDAK